MVGGSVVKPVGDHGLICLDGEDFSALPLALQVDALATNAALSSIQAGLDTYNNRPWSILTTTATTTLAQFTNEWTGVVTSSYPGISILANGFTQQNFGLDLTSFTISATLNPAGWYLVGGTCTFQATGAVTVNTRRDLILEWAFRVNGVTNYAPYIVNSIYESNTAGDALSVAGMFYADGTKDYFFDLMFSHKNAGSTMTVNAGARYFVAYLGTGLVI